MVSQATLNAFNGFPEAVEIQCGSLGAVCASLLVGNNLKLMCASVMSCFQTVVESMR